MGWSAQVVGADGYTLPTSLVDGSVELRNPQFREEFHSARDRVVENTGGFDAGLTCGRLHTHGSGRVLSLLAGHGGSIAKMDKFDLSEVINLEHAIVMMNYDDTLVELKIMGLDPVKDFLKVCYWSATKFVKSCARLGLGISCHRR